MANWRTHNVAAEQDDPRSLLNWYRGLIALRNAEPALAVGSFTPLSVRDQPVFAFLREHGRDAAGADQLCAQPATHALPAGFRRPAGNRCSPGAASPFAAAATVKLTSATGCWC